MIDIKEKKNCVGCYACYNICPQNAITLEEDEEGFKYPKVNREKCINCGVCKKVCPIINSKNNNGDRKEKPDVIAAWNKDTFTRLDSTSGGIFSELANKVFDEEGYVCGAIYDESFKVKHIVTNDRTLLPKLRSSKYLQSDINNCYKEIKELLNKDKKVLICGSPCQIAGLYNYLGKNYENLLTCDFICRGMNSPKIFKMYINSLENRYKSKVKNIKFKNKIYGWHNFSTRVDFENGKTYIGGRYFDSYMVGYLKYNAFVRPSCYECKFKDMPRKSDITLADFWGIEKISPELDNNQGTSLVLLNSEKGRKFFEEIKNIESTRIQSEKIFERNIYMKKSIEITKNRQDVFENIDNMDYDELSNKFFPSPKGKEKIKILFDNSNSFIKFKKIIKKILRKV